MQILIEMEVLDGALGLKFYHSHKKSLRINKIPFYKNDSMEVKMYERTNK